jgi:polycystin 1L2
MILDSCAIISKMENKTSFCVDDYSVWNEEKLNYGLGWSANQSYSTNDDLQTLYSSFQYTDSSINSLQSYPYLGLYNNYMGGGYVLPLKEDLVNLSKNLDLLKNFSWLDRQTRALFIEFSLYNPNVNLFAYSTILFEILPTGNIIKSYKFYPLSLLDDTQSNFISFRLICNLIYICFVIFFMIKEAKLLFRLRIEYFRQFWNYVELSIIAFSWAALAIYLYRLYAANNITNEFKQNSSLSSYFVKLQVISYWNDILGILFGFLSFFGTMKFLKLLRFNRRISFLVMTLRYAFSELVSFSVNFSVFFLAFVQLMHLMYHQHLSGFSNIIKSMQTSFEIILGKFEANPMKKASPIFGPFVFFVFNIIMVLIVLNIFLTIISDSFKKIRFDIKLTGKTNNEELLGMFLKKLKSWFIIFNRSKNVENQNEAFSSNKLDYIEDFERFNSVVNRLVKNIEEI